MISLSYYIVDEKVSELSVINSYGTWTPFEMGESYCPLPLPTELESSVKTFTFLMPLAMKALSGCFIT